MQMAPQQDLEDQHVYRSGQKISPRFIRSDRLSDYLNGDLFAWFSGMAEIHFCRKLPHIEPSPHKTIHEGYSVRDAVR